MLRFPLLTLPSQFGPKDLPCELRTRSGYVCTVRALQKRDAPALAVFFRTHSRETLLRRYGYLPSDLTLERAADLVAIDETRQAALAITEGRGATKRIVAVGRFNAVDDRRSAEVALVVHEERRRTGMATVLLEALAAMARARGIERFTAQTLADNFEMLSIFIKHGGRVRTIEGTDGIEVVMPLAPDPSAGS